MGTAPGVSRRPPRNGGRERGRRDGSTRTYLWTDRSVQAVGLILALIFVGLVTYLPHMQTLEGRVNPTGGVEDRSEESPWTRLGGAYVGWANGTREDYPFPMHVDADVHWVRSAAILRQETMRYDDPYTGQPRQEPTEIGFGEVHEQGFHLAFAQFHDMTGIPFILLIRFLPAAFAMLSAWLIWGALRPWPGAPLAAAFVALVPSSPRFLGIAFFVPIGLGLAWIAAALLMSKWSSRSASAGVLALVLGVWAFFIHLIVGFAFLLAYLAAAPLALRERRADLFTTSLAISVPVVLLFTAFTADFEREIKVLEFLPLDFTIFDQLGIPFLAAWALGSAMLTLRPLPKQARIPIVAATVASAVALGLIVINLVFDLRSYAMYDRWHQPFALFASVPVAYGIVTAFQLVRDAFRWGWRQFVSERQAVPAMLRAGTMASLILGVVLLPVAAGAVATPGLRTHLDTPFYYFMDYPTWVAFSENADQPEHYETFMAHPWQAPIFNALSGKRPYTVLHPGEPPVHSQDWIVYQRGKFQDDVWLAERGISLTFQQPWPTGPHWQGAPGGAYQLTPEAAEALYRAYYGG